MRRLFTAIVRAKGAAYLVAVLAVSVLLSALLPLRNFLVTMPAHDATPEHWSEIPEVFFILLVLLVAVVWGSKPALFTSVLSVVALNYYFFPSFSSLRATEARDLLTLIAFALISLTTGQLSARLKQRADEAERAKAEAEGLYNKLESAFDQASQAEAIRRSEPYIRLAQSIAKAGFFDWHIPSNTVFWSDTFYDVFGMDRSVEPKYENWLRMLHPEDRVRMEREVQEFLTSGEDQHEVDYRTLMLDGKIHWMNARWGLLRDPSGAPVRMVGAIIEVTERKRNEEAARTSEQFKSVLLDCVTHDVRTPLTSIRIAATTLLRDQSLRTAMGENQRELLGLIDEEAERLSEFVGKLIVMARIEAGELRLQPSAAQVKDIVAEALQRIRPVDARSRVQLRLSENIPPVNADSGAVAEVVYILVDNACKYASDAPILVSAHYAGDDEIHLAIEDQGPGIPPELRDRVFEKFYRIEEAFLRGERQPTRTSGSGMGLAIARGIVRAHGGRIWIEDAESGNGTKVTFTLPIRNGDVNKPGSTTVIPRSI